MHKRGLVDVNTVDTLQYNNIYIYQIKVAIKMLMFFPVRL